MDSVFIVYHLLAQKLYFIRCKDGEVVTTLLRVFDARLGVICGLPLLVLYSATRDFSTRTPVLPSPQKPTYDLNEFAFMVNFS